MFYIRGYNFNFQLRYLVIDLKNKYKLSDYLLCKILSWDKVRLDCFLSNTTTVSFEDFAFLCFLNGCLNILPVGVNISWLNAKADHLWYLSDYLLNFNCIDDSEKVYELFVDACSKFDFGLEVFQDEE